MQKQLIVTMNTHGKYNSLVGLFLTGATVAIRTDINVPIKNGTVQDGTRITESFKTIKYCLEHGAKKIIIIAHFGRPNGQYLQEFSLKQLIPSLEEVYGNKVELHNIDDTHAIENSTAKIVLIENIRFLSGEECNADELSQKIASLGKYYVNDAFSASHRAHASISGVAKYTTVYAGLLLQDEIKNIESILSATTKEKVCAIIGGSKVSTKFDLLNNLIYKAGNIMLGGGMANTFLYAQGFSVGKSLLEKDYAEKCITIINNAKKIGTNIILPQFVITAKEFKAGTQIEIKHVSRINNDDIILDVSLDFELESVVKNIDYIVWNGPLGAFETQPFKCGTESIARLVAKHTALGNVKSVIGGGDVVSAINSSGLKNSMTYISTGGGAFLEWLEGKELPGIVACKNAV